MKKLVFWVLTALLMVAGCAYAESDNDVLEYKGPCPHDVFDFEELLEEHQALVSQRGKDPAGYSTGICEICEEKFLLHPYDAEYSNVSVVSAGSCPHHYRELPAVIEEGWYTVGAADHQYKTYHMAVCVLCQEYIKYYARPSGGLVTEDMIKTHNWTEYGRFTYHNAERNQHVYIDICAIAGRQQVLV